jgi:heme a synthase
MSPPKPNPQLTFERYAFGLLLYTVLVILWGAWVRISRSGAGCGEHWPLCNGELIPGTAVPATLIEFSHRLSTGLYGILVVVLVLGAFRRFPQTSPSARSVRKAAIAVAFFTLLEAWIGARLVLSGWVADDTSLYRATFMALHQINSMLLSGSVFLVWNYSRLETGATSKGSLTRFVLSPRGRSSVLLLSFVLLVSMAGAVASLAGTLFPSETLLDGIQKDFADTAHPVLRYRIWHPLLALTLGTTLAAVFWPNPKLHSAEVVRARITFLVLTATTIGFGSLTLLLLSPVWMKLAHLSLAHVTWFSALATVQASASMHPNRVTPLA